MSEEQTVIDKRNTMNAIADFALTCDAKLGFCPDPEESVKIIEEYADEIVHAALGLLPPERRAEAERKQYDPFMIGPFKIAHVSSQNVSVAKVKIGERVFSCEVDDEGEFCTVVIFDQGEKVIDMTVYRGKVTAFSIAVRAMKAYIRNLSGTKKGRRGFLPREISKMEAAK